MIYLFFCHNTGGKISMSWILEKLFSKKMFLEGNLIYQRGTIAVGTGYFFSTKWNNLSPVVKQKVSWGMIFSLVKFLATNCSKEFI